MGSRSLLLLEGREHLARRRLMLPPFHGERMRAYEATVREVVAAEVESWPEDEPFALHPRMQAVTLEVILRAVFGVTDPARRAQLADALGRLLTGTSSAGVQFGVLLFRRFGGPDPLAAMAALRREIDGMLGAEIAERRADPREDILSLLVTARFEDGEPMDDQEIRDQLMTLLLAGHETTATGLAWTFDLLLRHPPVLERLVAAVDAGEEAYLRAVVSESLRLRPVIPLAGRRLSQELRVNGHVLPPDTDVTPAIWLAHTRPDRYPEPYAFRPERFLENAPATYAWVPFGGGVRRCIGAAFAEMEMRVVLAEILRRRTLRPASDRGRARRAAQRHVLPPHRNSDDCEAPLASSAVTAEGSTIRLSEVVGALSYALDLTEGEPPGHALRSCLIGMRLAQELGLDAAARSDLFYALLLKDAGCSANSARMAALFGADDHVAKRTSKRVDWSGKLPALMWSLRTVAPDGSLRDRGRRLKAIKDEGEVTRSLMQARCDRGAEIALLIGLTVETAKAIRAPRRALGRPRPAARPARRGDPAARAHRLPRADAWRSSTPPAVSTRPGAWPGSAAAAGSTRRWSTRSARACATSRSGSRSRIPTSRPGSPRTGCCTPATPASIASRSRSPA